MAYETTIENGTLTIQPENDRQEGEQDILNGIIETDFSDSLIDKVVFNFDKVVYINSLGIAEFISLMKYLGGSFDKVKFKFINVDKKIAKIFKMVELSNLADIDTK